MIMSLSSTGASRAPTLDTQLLLHLGDLSDTILQLFCNTEHRLPVQFGATLQASRMELTCECSGVGGLAGVLLLVCYVPGVAGWMLLHTLSLVAIHMATIMAMALLPLLPGWLGARAALCLGQRMLDISFTISASTRPPGLTCKIGFFHKILLSCSSVATHYGLGTT